MLRLASRGHLSYKYFVPAPWRSSVLAARYASLVDPEQHPASAADHGTSAEDPVGQWRLAGRFLDRDLKPYTGLNFMEEPLGLWWGGGAGWPRIALNDCLGARDAEKKTAYCVFRKLGWGMHSSVWLAGTTEPRYVALKFLTGFATAMNDHNRYWEADALDALANTQSPFAEHVLELRHTIRVQGKEESDGEHICLVTDLMGGSVEALRHLPSSRLTLPADSEPPRPLPVLLAKRILLHTLRGIAHTHRSGFIHADIRPSNVLFSLRKGHTVGDVTAWMEADPARLNPPQQSDGCIVQSVVSQPLPLPASLDEVMDRRYILADCGSAQPIDKERRTFKKISAPPYVHPPEVILGGPWDEKVDIWMFGCMARLSFCSVMARFVTLWAVIQDPDESMLYQMLTHTGEDFSPEQLTSSAHADKWFEETCDMTALPPPRPQGFMRYLRQRGLVPANEISSTARFLHRCLCLNPADRPSAEDLLRDPWFEAAV
ncbi:kinase-like protein [Phanerochaete sordida]|uniref:Kinase-like protein n=1 Tax=Phanerochaete sordida TaxID=48140 RepID=A0A9P3LJ34_9APHY|nr:kinase-like protein [Phanerochaete sordida]